VPERIDQGKYTEIQRKTRERSEIQERYYKEIVEQSTKA
jgi:hypothetical protein